jgi:hypothetical protein
MKYYTDYPFYELGDEAGKRAPVREIKVIGWYGDKYVDITVEGVKCDIKAGYIYVQRKRLNWRTCKKRKTFFANTKKFPLYDEE